MKISHYYIRYGVKGIRDLLLIMKKIVNTNIYLDKNRITKETVREIIKDISPKEEIKIIEAIFNWVRNNVKYYRDIKGVEEITYPYVILENIKYKRNFHSSDCDDMAVLLATLLKYVGFRVMIEIIAFKKNIYNHARVSVYSETLRRWLPLEPTSTSLGVGEGFKSELPRMVVEV